MLVRLERQSDRVKEAPAFARPVSYTRARNELERQKRDGRQARIVPVEPLPPRPARSSEKEARARPPSKKRAPDPRQGKLL